MSDLKLTTGFQNPMEKKLYSEVTIDNKKVYNCLIPDCGKAFKFMSEMRRHLTVHSKQRPFVCSYPDCGKNFKRADALSNHFRIHSRNTPFSCSEEGCEAQFVTKSALRYHLLKHGGEKTFRCEQEGCDKTFMTQAQLKQHEKASVYHQRINGCNSPFDKQDMMSMKGDGTNVFDYLSKSEKEGQESESNDCYERSEFLSYDHNYEGPEGENLDNQSDAFSYLDQVYGQLNQNFDETSSVETSEAPTMEILKKRRGDPKLLNLLNFIIEENKQLKKKIKAMSDVPSFTVSNSVVANEKQQNDVDLFFRTTSELDSDQFLSTQATFLY